MKNMIERIKFPKKPVNTRCIAYLRLVLVAIFIITTTSPSSAQTPIAEQQLLQRYINIALENNAGLQAGALSVESARLQSKAFGSLGDPQVEMDYNVWSRMEPADRFRVSIMQPIPWFGKLSNTRTWYQQLSEVESARYLGDQNQLVFQIRNVWYELHQWEHHIHITLENLEFLDQLEQQILARVGTGRASQVDALRIQIEKEMLQNQMKGFENRVDGLIVRFNALLNRKPDAEIEIQYELQPEPIPTHFLSTMEFGDNPEIVELERASIASQTAVEQTRLDGRPDFMVGIGLMNRDLLLGDPERLNTVEIMFRMNLPVYRGQYRAREQRAVLQSRIIDQSKIELKNQLTGEFEDAKRQLETAIRDLKLYRETLIPMVEQALEVALATYRSGGGAFEQIIQLQRQIQDFWMTYNTAVAEHNLALARMEFLSGQSAYTF